MRPATPLSFLGLCSAFALGALAPSPAPAQATPPRPNIVMFMVDDMGWMDSTVYGSEYYRTPNIERLAARGITFTNAYTANPLCTPTRGSILTGKYPGRMNLTAASGHVASNEDAPPINATGPSSNRVVTPIARNQLALEERTIAEALKDAGYDTIFLGKWHLGSPAEYWPEHQGFDINIGGAGNPGPPSYFSPYGLNNLPNGPVGEHITDRMTNEAIGYWDGRAGDPDPHMMFLWHWAVHAPYQGVPGLIDEYRGITDPRGLQDCTTMGAMLESMDTSLGQIMDYLDANDMWDDTLFVFFSDNGGNMYDTVTDPVTGVATTPTNNAPLSDGKGHIKEGGVRVPCIISWPGVITPGTTSDEVISSIDWYPTFLELAGGALAPGQIVDGVSLVDHLETGASLGRDAIYTHFPHYVPATGNLPSTSVRFGDWKMYRFYGEGPGLTNTFELYNLATDIGETTNVAEANPALVQQLDAMITQHLEDTGSVVPFPNPAFSEPVGGWDALNNIRLREEGGMLRATLLREDPFMGNAEDIAAPGPVQVQLRMRIQGLLNLQVFWATTTEAGFAGARSVNVPLTHDGQWRTVVANLPTTGTVTRLRVDPGNGLGAADFDWIRVYDATGSTLLQEWDWGGPEDGRPFEPYTPNAGWSGDNQIGLEESNGYTRATASGVDPFMTSPTFGPHPGPVRVELVLRSDPGNAPLVSQLMWANSQGSFGIAAGRGVNFNQTHSGAWETYSIEPVTPDINRLRLDPLQGSTSGQFVDIDAIRLYAVGTGRADTLLEEWDFGGELPGSGVVQWAIIGE